MRAEPSPLHADDIGLPTIYRFYRGKDKHLLYVGKTINPGRRGGQHRDTKDWWPEVGLVVYEHLAAGATAQDLDRAERRAIGRGWPLKNQQHNPNVKKWVRAQYPKPTDEQVFSYDLVERFARYKPSAHGPVPLSFREYKARRGKVEVDQYPKTALSGRDYGRSLPEQQITIGLGQAVTLACMGLVLFLLLLLTAFLLATT